MGVINTLYPNIPPFFPEQVRIARLKKGIAQKDMAKALGQKHAAFISQMETGKRSISYEWAIKFRDYLEMEVDLPEPVAELSRPIARYRTKHPLQTDRFMIAVDGEIIEVVSYRVMGRAKTAVKIACETTP